MNLHIIQSTLSTFLPSPQLQTLADPKLLFVPSDFNPPPPQKSQIILAFTPFVPCISIHESFGNTNECTTLQSMYF
jgi:hypothetical protein